MSRLPATAEKVTSPYWLRDARMVSPPKLWAMILPPAKLHWLWSPRITDHSVRRLRMDFPSCSRMMAAVPDTSNKPATATITIFDFVQAIKFRAAVPVQRAIEAGSFP